MVAKARIIRPIPLNTSIPEDLRAKLDAYLYSPSAQRIPKSAYSDFICQRIREFFDHRTNDGSCPTCGNLAPGTPLTTYPED